MNYDFNEAELNFFSEVEKNINSLADIEPLETRNVTGSTVHIDRVLGLLAQTPYLRVCLEPVEGLKGHLSLMGARQVLAGVCPSAYLTVEASCRLFGTAVSLWGDENQRQHYLAPVMEGRAIGALALSEATMNIENETLAAEGKRKGEYVLVNGHKQYVINAPIAGWIAVAGTFEGRYALFVAERDTRGLMIDPCLETTGYQGTPVSGISLDNCEIPYDRVIFPPENTGMPEILRTEENLVLVGASLGLAKTAFEAARDYAKSHRSGGKLIISYQEIGFKLAEMLTMLQTAQLLAYRTAWTAETSSKETDELVLCAKVFCTEACEQICSEALKILGGTGFIYGNRTERAYRCAKYGQISGTSTEISRVRIGNAALGYKD